jgi:DNA-binding GntR family transcriptional regulator
MQEKSPQTTLETDEAATRIIAFPGGGRSRGETDSVTGGNGSLHEAVVTALRELIVHNELAPGRRLNERVLCERLKVSRTPLREALKVLSHQGLVETLPNRGSRVVQMTRDDVKHLFEVIGALESLAGRLACEHIKDAEICDLKAIHYQMQAKFIRRDLPGYFRDNQKIHRQIVTASRNPVLAATHESLNNRLLRARYLASQTNPERWAAAMREHELIIDALSRRNAEEAAELLLKHLHHKYESICQHL